MCTPSQPFYISKKNDFVSVSLADPVRINDPNLKEVNFFVVSSEVPIMCLDKIRTVVLSSCRQYKQEKV